MTSLDHGRGFLLSVGLQLVHGIQLNRNQVGGDQKVAFLKLWSGPRFALKKRKEVWGSEMTKCAERKGPRHNWDYLGRKEEG